MAAIAKVFGGEGIKRQALRRERNIEQTQRWLSKKFQRKCMVFNDSKRVNRLNFRILVIDKPSISHP